MFGCRSLQLTRPVRISVLLVLCWLFVTVVYLRPPNVHIPASWKENPFGSWKGTATTTAEVATTLPAKPPTVTGSRPPRPPKPIGEPPAKAAAVKDSLLHAWNGYSAHAWGRDELKPVSKGHATNLNDWGITIVDTLDTLIIMGLRKEFYKAMDHVEKIQFRQNNGQFTPFFETVIRYLGGFLSTYAMVVDDGPISAQIWPPQSDTFKQDQIDRQRFAKILLDKADKLGTALLPIFKTDSHFPAFGVNTETGERANHGGLLAEIASYQFEFKYLAFLTGKKVYFDVANDVHDTLEKLQKQRIADKTPVAGMLPSHYDIRTGHPTQDYVAVGALADSGYEYLLKGYLLSGRTETRLLEMWKRTAESALQDLIFISNNRDMTFITDASNGHPSMKLEHLSCFYPGLLVLGSELLNGTIKGSSKPELDKEMKERYNWAAESIAETCYLVCANNPAHVGHETVFFSSGTNDNWWAEIDKWESRGRPGGRPRGLHGKDTEKNIVPSGTFKGYSTGVLDWLMRPETIESLYLLYRSTNDTSWQDRCHKVHQGIETHSRTVVGYGSIMNPGSDFKLDFSAKDIDNQIWAHISDSMPSYALAETFKYLFLCLLDPQQSEALLPRRKWIFSTEAHPFPVFEWTKEQIRDWKIR